MVNFFVDYNSCNNQEYINFEKKQKKDLFNLTLRPRLNMSSVSNYINTYIENQLGFGFGLEAEFIFSFNKNKWSFIIEPTYQSFTKEFERNVIVNYRSIEFHVGLRHYLFLNDNSKIFINASPIYDFSLNDSKINSEKIKTAFNMALGLGFKYNNKYSIELRHQTPRRFASNFVAEYKTLSIIFGYSLF